MISKKRRKKLLETLEELQTKKTNMHSIIRKNIINSVTSIYY